MNHYQGLFVCRQFRVGVVVTDESYALRTATTDAGFVDLRLAATVGSEVDGRTILAPERFGVDAGTVGNAGDLT
ncbi:hypothetical protein D3C71_1873760 [compost metagenome]